jgi:hypothetical protein
MGECCQEHHDKSGLTKRPLTSRSSRMLQFIGPGCQKFVFTDQDNEGSMLQSGSECR